MKFQPLTYTGTELPSRQTKGVPHVEHRCPTCNVVWVRAELLIDVRDLPISETYACDGCWTRWQREGRAIDGGEAPQDRREWTRRWLAAHGAPADVLAAVDALRQPEPYR